MTEFRRVFRSEEKVKGEKAYPSIDWTGLGESFAMELV